MRFVVQLAEVGIELGAHVPEAFGVLCGRDLPVQTGVVVEAASAVQLHHGLADAGDRVLIVHHLLHAEHSVNAVAQAVHQAAGQGRQGVAGG